MSPLFFKTNVVHEGPIISSSTVTAS